MNDAIGLALALVLLIGLPWAAWAKRPKAPTEDELRPNLGGNAKRMVMWQCSYHEVRGQLAIIIVGTVWFLGLGLVIVLLGEDGAGRYALWVIASLFLLLGLEWVVIALGHLSLHKARVETLID